MKKIFGYILVTIGVLGLITGSTMKIDNPDPSAATAERAGGLCFGLLFIGLGYAFLRNDKPKAPREASIVIRRRTE